MPRKTTKSTEKKMVQKTSRKKTLKKSTAPKNKPVSPPSKLKHPDYIFAVGRRKKSVARVRYYKKGEGKIIVNGKLYSDYFPQYELKKIINGPLTVTGFALTGNFTAKVTGGGIRGQAESIRLGISRLLIQLDPQYRPALKSEKYLVRDPRVKERKKYGLKKARRAPQWQKR